MTEFPHHYVASAAAKQTDNVALNGSGLPQINAAPPKQFGGPGDQWSPEDMIVATVAACFILTFRAIAAASKFEFTEVACEATGTLDKVERETYFTEMKVNATLTLPAGADESRAQRLLEKAEKMCFITNSLKAETHLESTIKVG